MHLPPKKSTGTTRTPVCKPVWTRTKEDLPPGSNLKYELWKILNLLRVGVAKTKNNLVQWQIGETEEYDECRHKQDNEHLIQCKLPNAICQRTDLFREPKNNGVIKLINYWLQKGI